MAGGGVVDGRQARRAVRLHRPEHHVPVALDDPARHPGEVRHAGNLPPGRSRARPGSSPMARRGLARDPSSMNSTSPQTLTRSTSDKKLGGVSCGLGAYLGVDPLLIRIGFVVTALTSGLGLIAYLAMLILVPADDAVAGKAPVPA